MLEPDFLELIARQCGKDVKAASAQVSLKSPFNVCLLLACVLVCARCIHMPFCAAIARAGHLAMSPAHAMPQPPASLIFLCNPGSGRAAVPPALVQVHVCTTTLHHVLPNVSAALSASIIYVHVMY